MSLLSLSNEILLQILGQGEILRSRDLCHVAVTCKRLSPLTEAFIWRDIWDTPDTLLKPGGEEISPRLRLIMAKLRHRPERVLWVRSAAFAWEPYRFEWSAAIRGILSKCPSIRTLSLRYGSIYGKYYDRTARLQSNLNFVYFLNDISLQHLSSLTLDDCRLTVNDIVKAFTIPTLTHLCIKRYDTSISGVLNLPTEITYDPTKLKKLEFWFCGVPAGRYVEPLLKDHPELEDFTWITDFGVETPHRRQLESIAAVFTMIMSTITTCYISSIEPRKLVPWSVRLGLDFSPFQVLKVLKVHERWLFGPSPVNSKRHDRCLLQSKLPRSIEDLTVSSFLSKTCRCLILFGD